jgi:hypothetical protein
LLDLLVRDHSPGLCVGKPSFDLLHHVKVVENVLETAVVRETFQKISNGSIGLHCGKASSSRCVVHAAQRTAVKQRPHQQNGR